jgi:nucleoid-associated protein YgaU
MALTKAQIEILDRDAVGAGIPQSRFSVQFNPTELTFNKGAQIAEIGIYGIDSPILQFIRGQNEKLTLDLYFDTTENGLDDRAVDVRTLSEPFYQLVKMQPKTHAPPKIRMTWGQGLSFKAIVESVQQKFDLFNPNGIPLRTTLSLSLREYKTLEEQLAELKLESADHSKQYVVKRGDTLSRIASREYGNPRLWREIALANPTISNIRQIAPGTVLEIPPLETFRQPLVNRP